MAQHNYDIFLPLIHLNIRSHITGSYLVNPELANDIDIAMLYYEDVERYLISLGFVQTSIKGYESKAKTLHSTYRNGVYNVLVIKDKAAYALWQAFSNVISNPAYSFTDKSDRIKLADLIMSAYIKEINDPQVL